VETAAAIQPDRGDAVNGSPTMCREEIAALHIIARAPRALALALLASVLLGAPLPAGSGARPAFAQTIAEDDWLNRDYFSRGTDGFTQQLLLNAERNHLAQENFWKKYRGGELDYALGDLKYVLLVFPNHPRALHLMTMVCRAMKDRITPIVYFEKATRLFPNQPYTFAQYGAYLIESGETEAGIARLKDALRLNPNLTYALGLLAEAQKRQRAGGAATTTGPPSTAPGASPSTSTTGTPSGSSPGATVR
jgi:tetratricopeptide (TPR) repeat protein